MEPAERKAGGRQKIKEMAGRGEMGKNKQDEVAESDKWRDNI